MSIVVFTHGEHCFWYFCLSGILVFCFFSYCECLWLKKWQVQGSSSVVECLEPWVHFLALPCIHKCDPGSEAAPSPTTKCEETREQLYQQQREEKREHTSSFEKGSYKQLKEYKSHVFPSMLTQHQQRAGELSGSQALGLRDPQSPVHMFSIACLPGHLQSARTVLHTPGPNYTSALMPAGIPRD